MGPLAPDARRAVLALARPAAPASWRRGGARLVPLRGASPDEPEAFDLRTPGHRYRGVVPLPGAHQRDNLLVAIRLLEEARRAGIAARLERVTRRGGAGVE